MPRPTALWERLKDRFSPEDHEPLMFSAPADTPGAETDNLSITSTSSISTNGSLDEPAASAIIPPLPTTTTAPASVVNPKKRRRAATFVSETTTTIAAPFKRGGRAVHSALTWGVGGAHAAAATAATATATARASVPKIVLDTPDGRSRTIYPKD